ncbi:MAG: hypothetical protein WC436_03070 [Candidatus Babeliales bacterium]
MFKYLKNNFFIFFLILLTNFSSNYAHNCAQISDDIEKLCRDTNNLLIELKSAIPDIVLEIEKKANVKKSIAELKSTLDFVGKFSSLYNFKTIELFNELGCLLKSNNKRLIAPLIISIGCDYLIKNLKDQKININKENLELNKKLDFYINLAQEEAKNIEISYFQQLNKTEFQLFSQIKSKEIFEKIKKKTTNNILKQLFEDKKATIIPTFLKNLFNKILYLLKIQ